VVADTQPRSASSGNVNSRPLSLETLKLIRRSFSSGRVARQFPLLAGLHRAVDGALVGMIVAVALMSCLSLHWQHRWTIAFTRLELTRNLTNKLIESTALIERHFLQTSNLDKSMVPTKVDNLLYLESPKKTSTNMNLRKTWLIGDDVSSLIHHGY